MIVLCKLTTLINTEVLGRELLPVHEKEVGEHLAKMHLKALLANWLSLDERITHGDVFEESQDH